MIKFPSHISTDSPVTSWLWNSMDRCAARWASSIYSVRKKPGVYFHVARRWPYPVSGPPIGLIVRNGSILVSTVSGIDDRGQEIRLVEIRFWVMARWEYREGVTTVLMLERRTRTLLTMRTLRDMLGMTWDKVAIQKIHSGNRNTKKAATSCIKAMTIRFFLSQRLEIHSKVPILPIRIESGPKMKAHRLIWYRTKKLGRLVFVGSENRLKHREKTLQKSTPKSGSGSSSTIMKWEIRHIHNEGSAKPVVNSFFIVCI